MKRLMVAACMVTGWLAVASPAWCAALKIGVVDFARVAKADPETETSRALLEKEVEDYEKEQRDLVAKLEEMKIGFEAARKEARNPALSDEAKNEKGEAAEQKFEELRQYEGSLREKLSARQKELSDLKARMRKRITTKLQGLIVEYAKAEGFTLILDSSAVGMSGVDTIMFYSPSIDVTDSVIKLLAKERPEGQ